MMKKILAVILSALMVFSVCFTVNAEETVIEKTIETVETDTPVIVVRGMNFGGGLQYDRGTENARPANVQFDAGVLFKYLAKTLATLITTFSMEAAVSVVCEYIVTLFEAYPCDENGDSLQKYFCRMVSRGSCQLSRRRKQRCYRRNKPCGIPC